MEPFPTHVKVRAEPIRYEGLEPVRKRPLMYVGSDGAEGLHHLAMAAVTNAVREAWEGHCTTIRVTLAADGRTLTVEDDGRGIPVAPHPVEGVPFLQLALTRMPIFGTDRNRSPYTPLCTLAIGEVSALSETLTARVRRDGAAYEQTFSRGEAQTTLTRTGAAEGHGTSLTFAPDSRVFPKTSRFDEAKLGSYLRDTAALNAGLRLEFASDASGARESYCCPNGLADLVAALNRDDSALYPPPPFSCREWAGEIRVDIAFQHSDQDGYRVHSFVNGQRIPRGGSHVKAFKQSLAAVVAERAAAMEYGPDDPEMGWLAACFGITAAVSVFVPYAEFEGATCAVLAQPEVGGAVEAVLGARLRQFLDENPSVSDEMVWRARDARRDLAVHQGPLRLPVGRIAP